VPGLGTPALASENEAEGVFRPGIDPLQLYVSMVALSYFHISNVPTLSHLFGTASGQWKTQRRRHVTEMMIAFPGCAPATRLAWDTKPARTIKCLPHALLRCTGRSTKI
jgi:Tetracyclin repressor-like, C-terminal domain